MTYNKNGLIVPWMISGSITTKIIYVRERDLTFCVQSPGQLRSVKTAAAGAARGSGVGAGQVCGGRSGVPAVAVRSVRLRPSGERESSRQVTDHRPTLHPPPAVCQHWVSPAAGPRDCPTTTEPTETDR